MLELSRLAWPSPAEVEGERLGGNELYTDLSGMSWEEARNTLEAERAYIDRINSAEDREVVLDVIEGERDELWEAGEAEELCGLEIGVASCVVALSALNCIPFNSSNGSLYGGSGAGAPFVAFFAKPEMIAPLLVAAREAGVSLAARSGGSLEVRADTCEQLVRLAEFLVAKCCGRAVSSSSS